MEQSKEQRLHPVARMGEQRASEKQLFPKPGERCQHPNIDPAQVQRRQHSGKEATGVTVRARRAHKQRTHEQNSAGQK
jgi:hypothetical protein